MKNLTIVKAQNKVLGYYYIQYGENGHVEIYDKNKALFTNYNDSSIETVNDVFLFLHYMNNESIVSNYVERNLLKIK